jgi:ABC-type multidrug transport system fused ATPase/permease subunit
MKGIRMLGLTDTVHQMLTGLRQTEVAKHGGVRRRLVWIIVISNIMFQLITCATYVTYTIIILTKTSGGALNYNLLYGSLSALKLVTSPLVNVLQLIPAFQAGLTSMHRMEQFLQGDSIGNSQATTPSNNVEADEMELLPVDTEETRRTPGTSSTVFSMTNASFAISGKPLLWDINFSVYKGSFTMVLGKIGAGKSILLRSIVGETELVNGNYNSSSSGIAFCDQSVWLRNDTIRGNITGEDRFDESWYREVLWSCGLHQDIAEMKKGDMTLVGSKGISLSGGQKNRITLARALYARKPLLVIDDMLAGLDHKTEKLVVNRVFGQRGILRKINATVVLATHATHVARNADRVIVLSDGRITETGTYQELLTSGINLQKLSESSQGKPDSAVSDDDHSPETFGNVATASATAIDEDIDDTARQSGDRKSLWFFLHTVGSFHCSLFFILLTLTVAATAIQLLWLKWWADSDNSSKSGTIRNLYLFIIITAINILLFLALIGHYALWFMPRSSLALHATQLYAFMHAKYSFLVSTDIGNITNRFSQDIVMVDNELQYSFLNMAFFVFTVMGSIGILIAATPPVAGVIPLLGAVGYCIQRIYLRTSRQVRLMDLEAKAPLCTHFLESLAGIITIRSFGWASAYKEKNDKHLDQSQVPFYLLFAIQNWLNLVLELVVAGLITVIVGLAVGLRSKVDPGYLGLGLVAAVSKPVHCGEMHIHTNVH